MSDTEWRFTNTTRVTKNEMVFALGKEFRHHTPNGKEVKITVNQEGENVWIFNQKNTDEEGREVIITRTATDEGIKAVTKTPGVEMYEFYTRL